MKYPTRKTRKNKNKKQYRGGVLHSKRKINNTNTSTNTSTQKNSKKFKRTNTIPTMSAELQTEEQNKTVMNFQTELVPEHLTNNSNLATQDVDLNTPFVDFESKENAAKFRQGLRNTEPPHTMMFNKDKEPVFIGKGVHGCAFKPPIQCSTHCNDDRCRDHIPRISKLMDISHATREINIYSKIDLNRIPESSKYFIANPYQCSPNQDDYVKIDKTKCPVEINTPLLLIYEDGGIDLNKYIKDNNYMQGEDKDRKFLSILEGLLNIFEGVRALHNNGIFHFDIKEDNIVIGNPKEDNIVLGKEKNNYKLIDFGNAQKMPFFCKNVQLTDIIRPNNRNTNTNTNVETQPFTPSDNNNATLKTVKLLIRVEPPKVIFRILPVYQFFITQPFKNNQPSWEDYELLANKFIETFMTITDNTIEIIRYYYKLTKIFEDDIEKDKIKLRLIFNKLYKNPDGRLSLINRTLDMYSIGLVILRITINKYRKISNIAMRNLPTIQFITDNKLLHPDPTQHLSIDEIIENYKKFFKLK